MNKTVIIPCLLASFLGIGMMQVATEDMGLILSFMLTIVGLIGLYTEVKDLEDLG